MTAISSAFTAKRAFIRLSIAYPTILFDQTSLTAQQYSFPSPVQRSVIDPGEARKRIRLLEQENEILRRAAAYLSQASLPK